MLKYVPFPIVRQLLVLQQLQKSKVTEQCYLLIRNTTNIGLNTKWQGQRFKASSTISARIHPEESDNKVSDTDNNKSSKKLLSNILVEEEPLDAPIKYSTSKASSWKAIDTHTTSNEDVPPSQPIIVTLSLMILLLYFCVLREENDIDEEMGKTLWERVPGLERKQLDVVLQYNTQVGLPISDVKKRIDEIDEDRRAASANNKPTTSDVTPVKGK